MAMASQELVSMLTTFRPHLQASLYRKCGQSVVRFPYTSCLYKRCDLSTQPLVILSFQIMLHSAFLFAGCGESRTRCRTEGCSRRKLCRPWSLYVRSLFLDYTLSVSLDTVVAALPVRLFSFELRERVSERALSSMTSMSWSEIVMMAWVANPHPVPWLGFSSDWWWVQSLGSPYWSGSWTVGGLQRSGWWLLRHG